MNIQDMKPSMIHLSVPPLTATFGKSEKENAAALMIWILANNGDTWRPVESKEIESITVHPEEKGWLRDMLSNPFIKFNFSDLVQDGYITREKAFTEKGLEVLFRSKWLKGKACTHHWTVTSECPKCLREELDEIERVFEMQRAAEKRADATWREGHPEREIVLPDRANLVLFLLERLEAFERPAWCCAGCLQIDKGTEEQQKGMTSPCECGGTAVRMTLREAMMVWDTPR